MNFLFRSYLLIFWKSLRFKNARSMASDDYFRKPINRVGLRLTLKEYEPEFKWTDLSKTCNTPTGKIIEADGQRLSEIRITEIKDGHLLYSNKAQSFKHFLSRKLGIMTFRNFIYRTFTPDNPWIIFLSFIISVIALIVAITW